MEVSIPEKQPEPLDWYNPGASIREFHASKAETRVLLGGRGSGKTTAIAVECIGHGFHNPGAKIYILRKTQTSNEDTTADTFEQVFGLCGNAYQDTGVSLFKKKDGGRAYRIPSKRAVELYNLFLQTNPTKSDKLQWLESVGERFCSSIVFAGVPHAQARASRFRGYECSMLILVEADQLEEEDVELGSACLRWKNAYGEFIEDTCLILDSNPPSPRHWIAGMERESRESGDKSIQFWHIPTEENRHNLPPNYIERLQRRYRKNPAMYRRMLMGEYAEAFDGIPVIHRFSMADHVYDDIPFPRGAYLVRGWDFGTTHAVIWSAYWAEERPAKVRNGPPVIDEYWWCLHEMYAEQSDVDTQCQTVLNITKECFPFWNDRSVCSGVLDYCDPAGFAKKDTGQSVATLRSYHIFPGSKRHLFQDGLTIVNRLMDKKDSHGRYVFRVDRKNCPRLHTALMGGYRYPTKDEPGFGSNQPLKGPAGGNFDHMVDALRYAVVSCMRIIPAEVEMKKPSRLEHRAVKPNRKKRWWPT